MRAQSRTSKKILVLTPRLPYPLIGGDKLRIYNICDYLYKAGHKLTLLSFVENEIEAEVAAKDEEKKIFSKVLTVKLSQYKSYIAAASAFFSGEPLQVGYFYSRKMAALVDKELFSGEYDTALVHLVRMAPYVFGKDVRRVLEMTDAISLNYLRSRENRTRGLFGWLLRFEEKRVRWYEEKCLESFDAVAVVSLIDKDYLMSGLAARFSSKIFVIPNGVSENFINFKQTKYDSNLIIFIGNLRSYQNKDAVFYFLEEIFSLIKKELPSVRFRIIGAEPPQRLINQNSKNGIEVTGKVDSVSEYVREAAVSVSPVRIGAGVQNKILESMALGIPVVSTGMAAGGVEGAKSGKHLLVADSPREFADAALMVLKDRFLREKLSRSGKEFVASNYRWSERLEKYLEII